MKKQSEGSVVEPSKDRQFGLIVASIAVLLFGLIAGCGASGGKKGVTVGAGVSTPATNAQDTPNNTAVLPTPRATSIAAALALAAPYAFGHGLSLAASSHVDQLQYVSTTYAQAEALLAQHVVWRPFDGVSSGTTAWVIEATGSFESDSRGLTGVTAQPAVSALVFVAVNGSPAIETYGFSNPLDLSSLGSPTSVSSAAWSTYGGPSS